jgi:hypothetical protein
MVPLAAGLVAAVVLGDRVAAVVGLAGVVVLEGVVATVVVTVVTVVATVVVGADFADLADPQPASMTAGRTTVGARIESRRMTLRVVLTLHLTLWSTVSGRFRHRWRDRFKTHSKRCSFLHLLDSATTQPLQRRGERLSHLHTLFQSL